MSALAIEHRSEARSQQKRRVELDWLRVLAVFGLIPFHVAIIFSLGQKDYITNAQSSEVLDLLAVFVTFWGIPLLFLVAGASAWFALGSRAPKRYVKERVNRLLIPLVFGMLTVVPLQVYFGMLTNPSFHQSFLEFYPSYFLAFSPDKLSLYLAHLWFIPILLIYSLITLPLFLYLRGEASRRHLSRMAALCDRRGVILLLGLPLGIAETVLYAKPVTTLLATYLFLSNWALFIFFLLFFVYGYALYSDPRFERAVRRHAYVAAALGVLLWIAAQQLLTPYVRQDANEPSYEFTVAYVVAMFMRGFISWFWVVAIVGLSMRFLTFSNDLLRYLNEAFYPVYVLHMPVLTIVGFYVVQWPANVGVKYVVIVALTLAITLGIYDLAIRRSGLARYLFGLKPKAAPGPGRESNRGLALLPAGTASAPDGSRAAEDHASTVKGGIVMDTIASAGPGSSSEDTGTSTAEAPRAPSEPAEMNLAQLFRDRSAAYGPTPRWRQRQDGAWRAATFTENQRIVNRLIVGLAALGARQGDVICILAGTRWEWMAADWAILGLGGVTTMIYASSVPATASFILRDSGARFVFVENRAQYDKLMRVRDELGDLRALILFEDAEDVAGDPRVLSFDALQHLSPLTDEQADAFAAGCAAAINPGDIASIVYTSGTTGRPKGVVHTHRSLLAQIAGARAMLPTVHAGMRDTYFLPPSHVLGRLEHFFTVDCGAENIVVSSLAALAQEMRDGRPDILLGAPRVYEKAYAAIRDHLETGSFARRRLAAWAVAMGRAAGGYRERGQPLPPHLRARLAIADRLVLRRVREGLGGRLQFAVSGSAPLDVEIMRFFFAIGIPLLEGWGLTETGGAYTVNMLDRYRLGTVGPAFPGHEVRIAGDGEILLRGPCLFKEYHNNPDATAGALDAEGWFHTGDIGSLDSDGFLRIIDRKKELIATAGGKKVAPQAVERLLQSIPVVSQACVYGDRKPYLVALLTMDPTAVAAWATRNGIAQGKPEEIWHSPRFLGYLEQQVAAVNAQLASYEQVKYYDVLDEDFTVENDLATPTLKIRRRQIVARYLDRFEALYRPTPTQWQIEDRAAVS